MQLGLRLFTGALVAILCILGSGHAVAASIVGDQTVGIITSFDALAAQGVDVSVSGPGASVIPDSFLGDVALFEVTSGSIDSGSMTLNHEGQSLILSNGFLLEASNLVIDLILGTGTTVYGVLKADVTLDSVAQGVQTLFDLTLCQNALANGGGPDPLCIDDQGDTLVNGFRMTLGSIWSQVPVELPDDQFGVALLDVDIEVVPEPSTLTLAGLGLLGLAAVGRRRRHRG